MNKLLCLLFVIIANWGCIQNTETEKHQNKRDRIIDVRKKVKEIKINDVFFSAIVGLNLMEDYLIISDPKPENKHIQLFDKKNFKYVAGTAPKGKGPGEITILGRISVDDIHRKFYVNDHGKRIIYNYDLDSVLVNSSYMPDVKMKMNEALFPDEYQYINDTLCIGRMVVPIGKSDFEHVVARWNMITGKIEPMEYKHPKIKKKRIIFSASTDHDIYAECYSYHDLMTICSLNGKLKYNIYGQNWDDKKSNKTFHYGSVAFCNDKIFASYAGKDNFSNDYLPTKFFVFDTTGNYLYTLEIGYSIVNFCFDKENNRIIMNLDEEMQFAYLDLDGIIE